MNWLTLVFGVAAICLLSAPISPVLAAEKPPIIVVKDRTVVAFFPPASKAELGKDPDLNEALADFQVYAKGVREPLKKAGVEFHELYTHSFQVRLGKTVTTFRPTKADVGYYFVVPGKKPRIEYGVITDADLLQIAHEYFGIPTQ
jgi:hypothetical protein